jgi:hypothetical protein
MEGTADYRASNSGTTKGIILNRLVTTKAVRLISIALMMVLPAAFFGGCAVGQVVAPFSPKKINPEPYNPEPVWSPNTDPTLIAIQGLKRLAGETTPPGAGPSVAAAAAAAGTTPGGTTPTPVPGPPPVPPGPGPRIPLSTDPVYGVVRDRIEGGVIPNATVTLTDKRNGVVSTFTTNAYGEYSFINLAVGGYYRVAATADGYSSAPLSAVDFTYFGISVTANLELIYNKPFQIIEGGNFRVLANLQYKVEDSTVSDSAPDLGPPQIAPIIAKKRTISSLLTGGTPDAMKVPFYATSTQQTYNSVMFEDVHGDWDKLPGNLYTNPNAGNPLLMCQFDLDKWNLADYHVGTFMPDSGTWVPSADYLYTYDTEPWAEFTFTVPSPILNKYSYDGLWVTFPNRYHLNEKGVWVTGGEARYFYYDWYDNGSGSAGWAEVGNTKDQSLGYINFTGINAATGLVSIAAAAYDSNPFVLTQARLDYDYRKDTTAPTFYDAPQAITGGHGATNTGSVHWLLKPQEQCFMTVNVTGTATFSSSAICYEGEPGNLAGPLNLATGPYSYTITATDLPGNTVTYSDPSYTFTIAP